MSKQGLSPEEQLKQLEAQLKDYEAERSKLKKKAEHLRGKMTAQGESFPEPSISRNRTEPYPRPIKDPAFLAKYKEISEKIIKVESEKKAFQLKIYEEKKLQFITNVDLSSQGIIRAISCLMGKIRLFPFSEKELPEITSDCVVGHYGLTEVSNEGEKKYFLILQFCYFVNDEEDEEEKEINLETYLREYPVNEDQLQLFALDIARGLNYLHIKRIAYKNLCLQNVLTHGRRVKLEHPAVVGSKMRNAEKLEIAEDLKQYGMLLEKALKVKRGEKSIDSDQPLRYLIKSIEKHDTITTLSDVISFLEERQPAEGANHFIDVKEVGSLPF